MSSERLAKGNCALLVCDIQEKFVDRIHCMPAVIHCAKTMVRAAPLLDYPIIVTEQYPKALGQTVEELRSLFAPGTPVVDKVDFSMIVPSVEERLVALPHVKNIILVGIEAHVCIMQTALDLLSKKYGVYLLVDGVSSQRPVDRAVALQRLSQCGVTLATSEMALFEIMRSTRCANFKASGNS
eukprot:jgi/Mesvir1/5323/Mv15415-RA.1